MKIVSNGSMPRPGPPSLVGIGSFVPEHAEVMTILERTVTWDERMRARRTASFGRPYDYSGMDYPPTPFLPVLESLRQRVAAAVGWMPNNCLLNLYADGRSTMGLHADSVEGLEPDTGIAIVSLGADRHLVFRSLGESFDAFDLQLNGGSLLHMSLSMQAGWRHGVRKQPGAQARISATFRRLIET